jgi:LysR family transcriptional regulator, benzoate and cis,cis-muconate-responsive activator of ben and cat genes
MVQARMELRHLRYFVAVAEEENVTRAAARLHVSQPAITRQIQELEEEIGVALFARTAKSIHLNEAGSKLLKEARGILMRVASAVTAIRGSHSTGSPSLNVGYAPTPTSGLLTPILRAFKKREPAVRLALRDASSCEIMIGLRSGKIQLAFTILNSRTPPRGFAFEPLREDRPMLGVAPDHPLARRRSVSVKELMPLPFVVLTPDEYPDYHEMLRMVLGPAVRRLRVVEECDSGTSLLTAIESGRAVGIASPAVNHTARGRVRLIPLVPAPTPLVVGVLYRSNSLPPHGQSLVEVARAFSEVK